MKTFLFFIIGLILGLYIQYSSFFPDAWGQTAIKTIGVVECFDNILVKEDTLKRNFDQYSDFVEISELCLEVTRPYEEAKYYRSYDIYTDGLYTEHKTDIGFFSIQ